MYRKYKDGSYSIPKEFIQIIVKPTQEVIDAIGLDYKIKEKINDDVTNDLVKLCDDLPEKFGDPIASTYGLMKQVAWDHFHKQTKTPPSKIFTIDLKKERIIPVTKEMMKERMIKEIDHLVQHLRQMNNDDVEVKKPGSIFQKINDAIFKK